MKILIDASAVMKLFVPEPGREAALDLWGRASTVYASRLAYPEVRAALARAQRGGRLSPSGVRRTRQYLERRWSQVAVLEVTASVARAAGDLADRYALRAGDAVHLASALVLEDPEVTVATWDRRLARAAHDAGLPVAPALG